MALQESCRVINSVVPGEEVGKDTDGLSIINGDTWFLGGQCFIPSKTICQCLMGKPYNNRDSKELLSRTEWAFIVGDGQERFVLQRLLTLMPAKAQKAHLQGEDQGQAREKSHKTSVEYHETCDRRERSAGRRGARIYTQANNSAVEKGTSLTGAHTGLPPINAAAALSALSYTQRYAT